MFSVAKQKQDTVDGRAAMLIVAIIACKQYVMYLHNMHTKQDIKSKLVCPQLVTIHTIQPVTCVTLSVIQD